MVTEVKSRERIEPKPITLQELGGMIGVPIVVRPWWGSRRRRSIEAMTQITVGASGAEEAKQVGQKGHLQWICSGGHNHTQPKYPEFKNGKIILWEGRCRFRYHWGSPKIHDHAQTIEVKAVGRKAMLIVIRRSPTSYSQFIIGVDGSSPYAVMVNRRLNTVTEAFDWLMPEIVRKAIEQGLDVKRQGDWFFIPVNRGPSLRSSGGWVYGSTPALRTNALYGGAPLIFNGAQTRHRGLVVYQSIAGINGPAPLVKGDVRAPDHETLHLDTWHIGVRNRSHPWRNAGQQRGRPIDD